LAVTPLPKDRLQVLMTGGTVCRSEGTTPILSDDPVSGNSRAGCLAGLEVASSATATADANDRDEHPTTKHHIELLV
jgi:hypothetical protein